MKKLILLVCIVCTGFVANATITIVNTSPCPFYMAVLNYFAPGSVIIYPVVPGGTTVIPGVSAGVSCSTSPDTVGQNDGGMFIDPSSSGGSSGYLGMPSSGSFL
ncbi:MAG: hypothetical protein JST36_04295, partial [Bacteroidetes bacterium]|nr:hypothetical protein [Bacteroidota bacterium]